MKNFIHKEAAEGKWFSMSLGEQLGNIGSEVGRASRAEGKNEQRFWAAVERALDLFDLTMEDKRWIKGRRLHEIVRAREIFCDAVYGEKQYGTTLADLEKYFMWFAIVVRRKIEKQTLEHTGILKSTKKFIERYRPDLENLAKK
ncbi:MAG: hypothetical protein A2719_04885 [Candidatus Ryanbacteria bacterium RIFCSPHIGHO2_01_FULL_45_22]|uniref:Uncharacterized protein n=1 Tax=Candidatus Ryanbacteria bacterium RIFCSPHIGHO2_01_FULL_45_22 TaxID=1802114 RepID=A0A1G2G249_9BACT|nr:MAG: hypothetical protein A2719_04885 [Candidatus Ryanbacteria bacterium RIFCSPHIGHO2_01_FULL_45_22]